ncbi:hypothetical protein FOZ61_003098 [Perkinsus olseni]|uniref:Uncharacterized protein n=1 Tax=Perkinsus olseni TaxID=32597 RepID=A0A7J6LQL0_PEROL|nr:hypothetical protein FOZ61_003098 [Perkinsus olseni]
MSLPIVACRPHTLIPVNDESVTYVHINRDDDQPPSMACSFTVTVAYESALVQLFKYYSADNKDDGRRYVITEGTDLRVPVSAREQRKLGGSYQATIALNHQGLVFAGYEGLGARVFSRRGKDGKWRGVTAAKIMTDIMDAQFWTLPDGRTRVLATAAPWKGGAVSDDTKREGWFKVYELEPHPKSIAVRTILEVKFSGETPNALAGVPSCSSAIPSDCTSRQVLVGDTVSVALSLCSSNPAVCLYGISHTDDHQLVSTALIRVDTPSPISCLCLSPGLQHLAGTTDGGSVHVWNLGLIEVAVTAPNWLDALQEKGLECVTWLSSTKLVVGGEGDWLGLYEFTQSNVLDLVCRFKHSGYSSVTSGLAYCPPSDDVLAKDPTGREHAEEGMWIADSSFGLLLSGGEDFYITSHALGLRRRHLSDETVYVAEEEHLLDWSRPQRSVLLGPGNPSPTTSDSGAGDLTSRGSKVSKPISSADLPGNHKGSVGLSDSTNDRPVKTEELYCQPAVVRATAVHVPRASRSSALSELCETIVAEVVAFDDEDGSGRTVDSVTTGGLFPPTDHWPNRKRLREGRRSSATGRGSPPSLASHGDSNAYPIIVQESPEADNPRCSTGDSRMPRDGARGLFTDESGDEGRRKRKRSESSITGRVRRRRRLKRAAAVVEISDDSSDGGPEPGFPSTRGACGPQLGPTRLTRIQVDSDVEPPRPFSDRTGLTDESSSKAKDAEATLNAIELPMLSAMRSLEDQALRDWLETNQELLDDARRWRNVHPSFKVRSRFGNLLQLLSDEVKRRGTRRGQDWGHYAEPEPVSWHQPDPACEGGDEVTGAADDGGPPSRVSEDNTRPFDGGAACQRPANDDSVWHSSPSQMRRSDEAVVIMGLVSVMHCMWVGLPTASSERCPEPPPNGEDKAQAKPLAGTPPPIPFEYLWYSAEQALGWSDESNHDPSENAGDQVMVPEHPQENAPSDWWSTPCSWEKERSSSPHGAADKEAHQDSESISRPHRRAEAERMSSERHSGLPDERSTMTTHGDSKFPRGNQSDGSRYKPETAVVERAVESRNVEGAGVTAETPSAKVEFEARRSIAHLPLSRGSRTGGGSENLARAAEVARDTRREGRSSRSKRSKRRSRRSEARGIGKRDGHRRLPVGRRDTTKGGAETINWRSRLQQSRDTAIPRRPTEPRDWLPPVGRASALPRGPPSISNRLRVDDDDHAHGGGEPEGRPAVVLSPAGRRRRSRSRGSIARRRAADCDQDFTNVEESESIDGSPISHAEGLHDATVELRRGNESRRCISASFDRHLRREESKPLDGIKVELLPSEEARRSAVDQHRELRLSSTLQRRESSTDTTPTATPRVVKLGTAGLCDFSRPFQQESTSLQWYVINLGYASSGDRVHPTDSKEIEAFVTAEVVQRKWS